MARKTYRKVITSDDKLGRINPENKKLMERFLREKSTRTSPATIKNYRSDLNIFFTWILDNLDNRFFVDIKKLEFSDFFYWCVEELKWGSARSNRMRSTLSSMSQFVERFLDEDYPNFRNVILGAIESMPKEEKRKKTVITDEQMAGLFEKLKAEDSQKACWLALAVSSGARFSELLRFRTDIIDPENLTYHDMFIETTEPIKTKGRGKNGKMLHKYILKELFLPYYEAWLPERQRILEENGIGHPYLFIKKNGEPATSGTVRSWIASIDDMTDFEFYAHALRHYLTTYMSKRDIPHQLIKDLFGWESIDLVGVYDDSTSKDRTWKELENLKMDI